MDGTHRRLTYLLIALGAMLSFKLTFAQERHPMRDPLGALSEQSMQANSSLPPYCYDYESEVIQQYSIPGRRPSSVRFTPDLKSSGRVCARGGLFEINGRTAYYSDPQHPTSDRIYRLWDGKCFWICQQALDSTEAISKYAFSQDSDTSVKLAGDWSIGGFLDGCLTGRRDQDWNYWVTVASRKKIASAAEVINGAPCKLISVSSSGFQAKFWGDARNFTLRKASARFTLGKLPWREWLKPQSRREGIQAIEYEIDKIRGEMIDGVFFPVAGEMVVRTTYWNGKILLQRIRVHRKNIRFHPDFKALGAFSHNIPNGALLTDENSAFLFQLKGDTLIPYVDPTVMRGISTVLHDAALQKQWHWNRPLLDEDITTTLVQANAIQMPADLDLIGPRSGLYSLCAALMLMSNRGRPEMLFRKEFLSSRHDSTLDELAHAARSVGLNAEPVTGLTTRAIRNTPYPLLLHVKPSMESKKYEHYEIYLGPKEGQAWLYDVSGSLRLEPFTLLVARWDGSAVAFSSSSVSVWRLRFPVFISMISWGGVIGVAAVMAGFLLRRLGSSRPEIKRFVFLRLTLCECCGFLAVTLILSIFWHWACGMGLLANSAAVNAIYRSRISNFINKIEVPEVKRIVTGQAQGILIDARDQDCFRQGHIPTAINVNANFPLEKRRKSMRAISKDAKIIVYCLNESCSLAQTLLARLSGDGYSNLHIFTGGWERWAEERDLQ